MKMNLPDILFVDCFFYGFFMRKQDFLRYTRSFGERGVAAFLPSKKRYLTVQPMHMQRERDSKTLLSRSRSRMHSLDSLGEGSPTTPNASNEKSEESNTMAS